MPITSNPRDPVCGDPVCDSLTGFARAHRGLIDQSLVLMSPMAIRIFCNSLWGSCLISLLAGGPLAASLLTVALDGQAPPAIIHAVPLESGDDPDRDPVVRQAFQPPATAAVAATTTAGSGTSGILSPCWSRPIDDQTSRLLVMRYCFISDPPRDGPGKPPKTVDAGIFSFV